MAIRQAEPERQKAPRKHEFPGAFSSRADWTPVELFRIAIGEILPLASEIEECLVDFSGS